MNNPRFFLQLVERTVIYCSSPVAATGLPGTERSSELECGAGAIMSARKEIYGARWMSDPSLRTGDTRGDARDQRRKQRLEKSSIAAKRKFPPADVGSRDK